MLALAAMIVGMFAVAGVSWFGLDALGMLTLAVTVLCAHHALEGAVGWYAWPHRQ